MQLDNLKYSATHEWARLEGDVVTIGLSAFAVEVLTDLVYLQLPELGVRVTSGAEFGEIESVKAVSPLYSPVSGVVVATNEKLVDELWKANEDPYGAGWLIKVQIDSAAGWDSMLTAAEYEKQIREDG